MRTAIPWPRTIGLLIAAAALVYGAAPAARAWACTCPSATPDGCISIARSGVGSPYLWGHAAWSTRDRNWMGADCSGLVVKAWQVPRASATWEDYHPYGTWHLFRTSTHWYGIQRGAVDKADAVGYPDPDGSSGPATGHVVLYYYGDAYGNAMVIEAPGSGQRIRQDWRDVSAYKWRFIRRHNLQRPSKTPV